MTPTRRGAVHSPLLNHLLAALPAAEFAHLGADLELVPVRLGDVLYEPGQRLRHSCFPTTALVSLHYVTASGASAESAGVGPEGVLGISLFMGGDSAPSSALVQTGGHGYRLERAALLSAFERAGPFSTGTAALYAGAHRPDHADGRLLPPSLGRTAAQPLAADDGRPPAGRPANLR